MEPKSVVINRLNAKNMRKCVPVIRWKLNAQKPVDHAQIENVEPQSNPRYPENDDLIAIKLSEFLQSF